MNNNSMLNSIEYEKRVINLESYPKIVFVETTRNCNLNCPMCERATKYGNTYSSSLNMDLKTLLRISDVFFERANIIDFHGNGEFLCYPYFSEAIKLATDHNCRIRTVTNLCTSNARKIEILASNVDILCVSMDSPHKETYESLRLGGKIELVINNLQYLVKMGRNDVIIMMTIARDNLYELHDMLKFVSSLGLNKLYIWQRFLEKEDPNNIIHYLSEAKEVIIEATKKAKTLGVELRMLSWPEHREYNSNYCPCIKPWMSIHINYDSTIGMCDFNETPSIFNGLNINDQDFDRIWNSVQYIELRRKHILQEHVDFCSDVCIGKRFIDFEELIYPPKYQEIISGDKIANVL